MKYTTYDRKGRCQRSVEVKRTNRKVVTLVLVSLLCVGVITCFSNISVVNADVIGYYIQDDGWIMAYAPTYEIAHDKATGQYLDDESTDVFVGQYNTSVSYNIYRGYLLFNTATLPDTATVTSAVLSLYITDDESDTDFNVTIQNGQPTYPHIPLQTGDYYYSYYSGDGGSRNTSSISGVGYWNITFSEDGLDWLSLTGNTKLCLRSSNDINDISSTGDEYIIFYSAEMGGQQKARLYITYTVPSTPTEGQYSYTFYGPFSEETGYALEENVTVHVYSSEGAAYDSFLLDETYIYNVSTYVEFFQFTFEDNSTREYWMDPSESNITTIYVFWGETTTYTVTFTDTTGVLNTYPFVTVKRYINGTLYTVEKRKVDSENKIVVNVIPYRTYQLFIGESTAYSFGDLTFGASTSITLAVKSLMFPEAVIMGYRYVRCYANRDMSSGTVYAYYQDLLEETINVTISIYYQSNSSLVTTSTQYVNEWSYSTSSLDNETDYFLTMQIYHTTFDYLTYRQVLPRLFTDSNPWDLSIFGGDSLPFSLTYIIGIFAIMSVAGAFSAVNTVLGLFSTICTAIIIAYVQWLPIPVDVLVFAFALIVIFAIATLRRHTYS